MEPAREALPLLPPSAFVLQIALAAAGLPALWILLRRRGGPRDPVPRGSAPAHVPAVAAALAAYLGAQVVAAAVLAPPPEPWLPVVLAAMALAYSVGIGAGAGVLAAAHVPLQGRPAPALRSAAAGALSGLAFLPVALLLSLVLVVVSLLAGWNPKPQRLVELARHGEPLEVASIAVLAVVVAPVAEEWIFRGFLLRGLRAILSPGKAVLISAAAFSLVHLEPGNAIALPATFLLGLALADLAERTGGLVAPIAMHACYNGAQVAVMLVARGAGGPPGGG